MHYHLEIVMPPTDDVEAEVEQIMAPFDENGADDEDHNTKHAFWCWYVIGGRWSGAKLMDKLGRDRVAKFRSMLHDKGVTVSGVQFGKPTLQPITQVAAVDAMWRAAFPESGLTVCPIFDHYKGSAGDVMTLADVPAVACSHVIIAGPNYKGDKLEAKYMVSKAIWNGVTHVKTAWDGTVSAALVEWTERLGGYGEEWRLTRMPAPDWLVVTVDYHS